ncbi:unnamed protein product, partial [Phaeothamnion confervicola]
TSLAAAVQSILVSPLTGGEAAASDVLESVTELLVAGLSHGMVTGEDPKEVRSDMVAFLGAVYDVGSGAEDVNVTVPQSTNSVALGRTPVELSMPTDTGLLVNSGYESLSLGVAELGPNPR